MTKVNSLILKGCHVPLTAFYRPVKAVLKIMIFVPFAMRGDLSFLGNLFPMASILPFNSEEKSSCHDHCFGVETRQFKHKTAN